jgi:predicted GNAT family N-acyltransferase
MDELVAYARIFKSDDDIEPVVIGRVIVSPAVRGEKLGYQLMEQALASCRVTGRKRLFISAPRRTCNVFTPASVFSR